ncbi:ABC transporter substrate-binding protein [Streptomyces sp. PTY087I2]|uniref:ABC transporter substrate-binding protein n=1 Tax=Streptomyces sp. PTY087I2 TaxID=1819298 RepID=UPI00080B949F|nr:extracellular solute-binding protein [Streptomyces sp. PTY087I2]OCC08014.1 putative sugar-binding periplasmic protein precursor [Streptomyces sp. PTY087I2]
MRSIGGATQRSSHPLGRRSVLAGLGAGAAATLAGCARGDSTAVKPGTTSLANDNATWDRGYVAAGRELKKLTGYALRPLSNPNPTSYKQVTQISLQTTKATDMIKWASGYFLKSLARTGELSDLSSIWTDYERKGWVTPQTREAMSYRGSVYGMPLYESYYVLFYNTALFRKHGLRAPDTWDELLHNAEVLKKAGVVPFVATQTGNWPAYEWFQELVSKVDPVFYGELTTGKAQYTDPQAQKALQIWQDFMRKGWMTPADFDQNNGPAALKAGRVGMFLHGSWQSQGIAATGMKPGVDFDAFVMPPVERSTRRSVITESGVLAVPRKAVSHEAAMANAAHWLDPRVQKVWTDFLQDASANPRSRPGNPVMAGLKDRALKERWTLLPRYGESGPPNLIQGNTDDLGGFMTGASSPQATLRSMASRAAKEWAEWERDEA